MAFLVPALALALFACDPGPLDLTGRRCDGSRACGEGWFCHQGVCLSNGTDIDAGRDAGVDGGLDAGGGDAGVDGGLDAGLDDGGADAGFDAGIPFDVNLLANPGFESIQSDGGVSSWRASPGLLRTSSTMRSGNRGAWLASTGAQQQPALLPSSPTPGTELGMLFCARIWVRGPDDGGVDVTLTIRDRLSDGGIQPSAGMRINNIGATWRQLREEHVSFGGGSIELRLVSNSRLDAGDGFFVDDAELFRSSAPVCP
jgi:hypothetical protein